MEHSMPNWNQSEKLSIKISSRFVFPWVSIQYGLKGFELKKLIFLQVSIHFGTVEISSVAESPQYTGVGFMNSLGGAFSLFLGCSFLTLFEGVELTIRILYSLFKSCAFWISTKMLAFSLTEIWHDAIIVSHTEQTLSWWVHCHRPNLSIRHLLSFRFKVFLVRQNLSNALPS